MNLLKKICGFVAVCSIVPAAYALTARPGAIMTTTAASRRLPTMTAYINTSVSGTTSSTTSSSSLLDNAECIEAYTSCLEDTNACGPNFEECTTDVLFHAQMPKCLSTLAQCTASGINALFGTSSTTALSNIKTKNEYDEVTDYVYPTDGSVLGQMIAGAAISNTYNTSDCVRRYTTCLQRDNVCGADFELCTTSNEFRKQMVYCDSTLARCQSEGKIELFGSTNTKVAPSGTSRIGIMISEGAALAAVNAVSTCYKVVDQCILNACTQNPYKCIADSSVATAQLADAIKAGVLNTNTAQSLSTVAQNASLVTQSTSALTNLTETITNSSVQSYIKNECFNTIGSNKYCYMTFMGKTPTASQLSDMDEQEAVFADAYAARMNSSMKGEIAKIMEEFDTEAKATCSETIASCVMRVCGSGVGAACYAAVNGTNGNNTINGGATYNEIKTGCEAIVNTDVNCQYAAANPDDIGGYSYSYIDNNAFDILFPEYSSRSGDPIGVIASLNASLATSYSDAAIAQMRTRCENVAKSCVKSMCGDEYTNCYRNRTDIYSSLTNTGTASFDNSMNKVGGVLDYTIVLGLCLDTVKNADVCQEHLAIETAKMNLSNNNTTSSWGAGTSSVRSGWLDAGSSVQLGTVTTEEIQATDFDGNLICRADNGSQGICDTLADDGSIYDEPVMLAYSTYQQNLVVETMFSQLVYDLEKEVQAIYNSKLTQEQNMCMAANNGGIMTGRDTGSTFMWAKLRSNRVPNDYNVNGLTRNNIDPSNELYGSFCAVRVTIQSDDAKIQEAMRNADWTNAYFAVGDSFTCGSWIPADELEDIAEQVASDATADQRARQNTTRNWMTVLGSLAGMTGGAYLATGIANGTVFNKLTGVNNKSEKIFEYGDASRIIDAMEDILEKNVNEIDDSEIELVESFMTSLKRQSGTSNANKTFANNASDAVDEWVLAQKKYNAAISDKDSYGCDDNGDTSQSERKAKKRCEELTLSKIETMKSNASNAKNAAENALYALDTELGSVDGEEKEKKNMTPVWSALGAVGGGVAGGFLLNKATRDIQASNLSAAEKAAYEEWMDDIGKHIRCYIGPNEVGQYGDMLSVTID